MTLTTNQLADPKTISDATSLKLEEYFIELVDNAMRNSSLTPSFTIEPIKDSVKSDCLIYLYVKEYTNKYKAVSRISIIGSINFKKDLDLKYIGKIFVRDYEDIEGALDTALSNYRTVNFKKISHKQRHMEGRYDT